jgi:hypothetical protein
MTAKTKQPKHTQACIFQNILLVMLQAILALMFFFYFKQILKKQCLTRQADYI